MSPWCNDLWPEHRKKQQFFSHHDSANWFHTMIPSCLENFGGRIRCWIYPGKISPFLSNEVTVGLSWSFIRSLLWWRQAQKLSTSMGMRTWILFCRLYHWDSFLNPLSIIHQSWIQNLSNLMTSLIRILIILRSGKLFFCQELSSCGSRRPCVCLGAQMMNRPVSKAN